jgi:hypothetical protein
LQVRALVYRKNYTPGAKYLQALEKPSLNTGRVFFKKRNFFSSPEKYFSVRKGKKKSMVNCYGATSVEVHRAPSQRRSPGLALVALAFCVVALVAATASWAQVVLPSFSYFLPSLRCSRCCAAELGK